jgi:uncharacterized protein (DUF433 family)/DNA-binding transcriptional MerR regulator
MWGASEQLLGIGIYTVPEASRLTGVSPGRIRRWLRGYTFRRGEELRYSEAVWRPELPEIEGELALGFRDLIEIRFVDAFRNQGVSWKTIRLAATRAMEMFGTDHPFSTRQFLTDGKTIFAEIIKEGGKKALLDLPKSQFAFRQIVSRSIQKGLEFSPANEVIRWWPLGLRCRVVLDPQRAFGQPIVTKEGVPTTTLAEAIAVEGTVDRVARIYDVGPDSVRDAIRFEKTLAA